MHTALSLLADSSFLAITLQLLFPIHPTLETLIPLKVESLRLGRIENNTIRVLNLAQEPNTMTKGLGSKPKVSNSDCQCWLVDVNIGNQALH